jgi:hypothetical protein
VAVALRAAIVAAPETHGLVEQAVIRGLLLEPVVRVTLPSGRWPEALTRRGLRLSLAAWPRALVEGRCADAPGRVRCDSTTHHGSGTNRVVSEERPKTILRLADYVYYCIYRFVSKTPDRGAADVWPVLFLALALCTHAFCGYFVVSQIAGFELAPLSRMKVVIATTVILLSSLFFWHYVYRGYGERVVIIYSTVGREGKYARVGLMMFVETLLLPFIVACVLVAWTKLTR